MKNNILNYVKKINSINDVFNKYDLLVSKYFNKKNVSINFNNNYTEILIYFNDLLIVKTK